MPSLTRWIECVGCGGEVGVPDGFSGQTATCPKCGALVAIDGSGPNVVQWRPAQAPEPIASRVQPDTPNVAPVRMTSEWRLVAGWLSLGLGIAGFIASYRLDPKPYGNTDGALAAGLLNPLFFIGVPLGIYWLKVSGAFATIFGSPEPGPAPLRLLRAAQSRPGTPPATAIKRATAPEIPSSASLANTPSELPAGSTIDSPEVFEHFLQEQGGPRPFKPKPDYLLGIVLTVFAAAIVAIALFASR